MRVGIRIKQVLGVLAIVSLTIVVQGGYYLASLTHLLLESSRAQAKLMSNSIYQVTFRISERGGDTVATLGTDEGLRSVLESVVFSNAGLVSASISDPSGHIIADAEPSQLGKSLESAPSLDELIDHQGVLAHLRAIYTRGGLSYEVTQPLQLGSADLGTIRVVVSTLLLREELEAQMVRPLATTIAVLVVSILGALLLARLVLRPINMIRGGLARLGKGELDVNMELPDELSDLGASFKQVTARLAAERTERAGQRALESVVDRLEDAVALFGTDGTLRFANTTMKAALGLAVDVDDAGLSTMRLDALLSEDHPYRLAVERGLADGVTQASPMQVPDAGERLVLTNVVRGSSGEPIGVLLVSRNLAYISQVESTLSYSRKLSALNRLTAGIAHEIKNPLNATMIHLELLKMQVADRPDAMASAGVIADQVRRLDEVVQGFLKFSRPEDLHLEAVDLAGIMERLRPVLDAEAGTHAVEVRIDVPDGLPAVEGDRNLLEQAFLNLGLNACQAMPEGGRLTVTARPAAGQMVAISVEDTGVGIEAEHLSRIFDLYFTTKPHGSGIGLSLVFRTIQLHNGEIEVQSLPGRGTTFRVLLRQAPRMLQRAGG
jgi:signal transduction histidine kinase